MIPVTLDRYLDPNLSRNKVDIEQHQEPMSGACNFPIFVQRRFHK